MKAQLSLEYMVILTLLIGYLLTTLGLYKSTKQTLMYGSDRLMVSRIERWLRFIASRPEGTEILYRFRVPEGHRLWLECGSTTQVSSPFYNTSLDLNSVCKTGSYSGCLRITRIKEGVGIGACD